ncbi:MAG: GYF domain-containing protein [Candidatus Ratteibacteria bacterium]|nr:GYF domain-containing protein [Candidatus Ratteibacteria bacterium]
MGWQIKTKDGAIYGPVDSETLNKWVQEKRILEEDFVWLEGKNEWITIKSVPELQYLFKEGAHPPVRQEIHQAKGPEQKSSTDALYDDKNILTDQLIADAWRAMLAKGIWSIIGAIVLIGLAGLAIYMVGALIVMLTSFIFPHLIFIGWPLFLLIIVASFNLGWAGYCLKIARREKVSAGTVFAGFKSNYIWQALGAILLIGFLCQLAGAVSFGIWGFYLQLSYMLSFFFIFDENRGPWQSMKASFDATKGYKWRIMSVQIICMLLGILFLGIGLFVTIPLAYIATASLYYRIRTGRIAEKHLRTSFAEYLIVLIPFIIMIFVVMLILTNAFKEQLPSLLAQIKPMLENLPKPQLK